MQKNHRNQQKESDIVETSESYTCVKNRDWDIVFFISLAIFVDFFLYEAVFMVNVIKMYKD